MAKEKLPKGLASIALVMMVCVLPPMFDSTIVNVAVNSLAQVFATSLDVIQWTVTGYALALGIATPFSGWLIQRIDGKKVFMGALVLFLVGSLLSGVSWNIESLIVFRVVQGLAAGILMTSLQTLLVQMVGSENLGKLMALASLPGVFAPIVGPVIGGLIVQYLPWNWLFLVNLPIGVVGVALIQWKMPRFEVGKASIKLDWPGLVLLTVASGALVYGITQVVKAGSRASGMVFLLLGAAAFVAYVLYGLRKKEKALVPLSMFRSKNFTAAFIGMFLAGFALNGPMLLFPMFFQNVFLQDAQGLTVILSALWLVPQGLGMLITRPLTGRLIDRVGARVVAIPSILVTLIGTLPFAFLDASAPPLLVWGILLVRGAGVGGFMVPLMADIFTGLPKAQVPLASVANRIIQNIGAAFGSAVLATVVSTVLALQPSDLAGAYHAGFFVSLLFMAVTLVPALFLTDKLKERKASRAVEQAG